jgi:sRNA-binding protein
MSVCCDNNTACCCDSCGVLQALEAARKQLQKREAELAEATAEAEAAAGERAQIKEQVAASATTIQGTPRLPDHLCSRHH